MAESTKTKSKKEPEKAMREVKKTGCLGGILMFLFLFCVAAGLAIFAWMAASDVLSLNNDEFTVTVTLPEDIFHAKEGTGRVADVDYIADLLHKNGLIDYKWLFKSYCDLSKAETKFDPGEYELSSTYDYRALVHHLCESAAVLKTVTVTIPEGFTMQDIFRRFEEEGVAKYDDLMDAAATATFKYDFLEGTEELGASRLEGFLFPDTYEFYVNSDPASAINKMLSNFYLRFNQDYIAQCERMNRSVRDIVNIASLIEKEAKLDDDRPYVASVVYNRFAAQMTLGFDTTILYVHQDHEGEPTQEMIEEDSPYNTRKNLGLPPTPICNPGMASITAAMNPASSYYYYFYADFQTGKLNFFVDQSEFLYYQQTHPNE